jgi:hypothetical protein
MQQQSRPRNGLALAGLYMGLLGLFLILAVPWCSLGSGAPFLGIVFILVVVLGLILSAVGRAKAKGVGGKGVAIAGLVLGTLCTLGAVGSYCYVTR